MDKMRFQFLLVSLLVQNSVSGIYGIPAKMDMAGPNGYANCGCVPLCAPEVLIGMPALLQTLKNDVVCGLRYQLCCLDDPWAGPIDHWKDEIPCQAEEVCVRKYGDSPYDIQNYGTIGPCLGLGSVRCLDNIPGGPIPIVIPIYEDYPIPPPTVPTLPPPPPPTTAPPVIIIPPVTEPPTVYVPPVIYEPPTLPPAVYEPPATHNPPEETYVPPAQSYEPPTAIVETEPPVVAVDVVEPPSVTYGIPVRRYGFGRGGYGFPYRGGFGGYGYPGFGFRKSFRFSKGFYG